MIRVVTIDDEPLALRQLEIYIGKIPYLELIAACPSAAAARPYVEQADVLYVDINMPDLSGMDFVRSLEHPPLVVFTTAYSEYALDSYKVHAADYLLKPFSFQEFEVSAAHLRDRIEASRPRAEARPETLTFRADYKTVRVEPDRIRYVESMSEYLKIWLRDEPAPLVVLYSLKRLAEQLPQDRFLRIHRSYLVNLSLVREFTRTSVILEGGVTLPVSDLYRPALREALGNR
jgi:two-component system LytT family response regulator